MSALMLLPNDQYLILAGENGLTAQQVSELTTFLNKWVRGSTKLAIITAPHISTVIDARTSPAIAINLKEE